MTNQILNYQKYISLPLKIVKKAEQLSPIIQVRTPHKGLVIVELKEVDKGMFRAATEISRETESVIRELYLLEIEAKSYLLGEWLKTLQQ